ncbi:cation diffusion facilitator family transporter [Rickettsiales bacterium]|nr:cation diffusion facilitator family transporter [Rickettsiales bacterium]
MSDLKLESTLMRRVTLLSVTIAIIIVTVKIIAWFFTDSLSLLSSLVDSVFDILASCVGFFAVRVALEPADEDHRFGHGKAEDIAAFSQSAFIAGSGIFILGESIRRIFIPHKIDNTDIGILVMLISTFLTLILITYQQYVIKKTNSSVIKADNLHYKGDLLVNLLVIFSFFSVKFFDMHIADPLLAFVIALYIFKCAWKIAIEALDNLMDKEMEDVEKKKIIDIILDHAGVLGMHDLKTRRSGRHPFIQFHLEIKGEVSLKKAHEISEKVEKSLLKSFPKAEILIHQDPKADKPLSLNYRQVVPVKRR